MIEKQSSTVQLIISSLNRDFGLQVVGLTFLPLGADSNASLYKAQALDQRSYFVKLKRGHHHDTGVTIAEYLHQAGVQQVILPVKTIKGELTQTIEDLMLIVYPFIKGQNGFNNTLTDNQWIKFGRTLRQIHQLNLPSSIEKLVRRETYSPKWREALRSLYRDLETVLPLDDIALELSKFLKNNRSTIHQLADRAEQLSKELQNQPTKFVLCHSDIHGGNVMMDGEDTIYIVDWDDPIMAPKERDLMFIGGGVGNVWNKPHEEELFYKGYGTAEVNATVLSYYRHERIVEDIVLFSQALLFPTAADGDRPEMYKQFTAMFEPKGVVDIAFQTDNG